MFGFTGTSLLGLARSLRRGGVIINEHTLSRAEARFHLEVLGRWFDFVGLDELSSRLARPAKRPFCLLTFDDGKRSHFTEVAPELQRQGVPAVFYVTTNPVTTGCCFWFDRRDQLLKAIGHCPSGLELNTLKQMSFDLLAERLERACAEHGFKPAGESADLQPMSWDEVRSLASRGFVIGAHGVTHAILTRETQRRAFAEIQESLATVSLELGAPCTTFAFPNGNYDAELARHALRCGATTVMTTDPLWADGRTAPWRLPRIQLFGGFSRARIETKLALAAVTGVLANPNGTGRSYRALYRAAAMLQAEVVLPEPRSHSCAE
jgi:peptidoglycan/xylan/chitin deacetylase (PgdA/CDA1 family)